MKHQTQPIPELPSSSPSSLLDDVAAFIGRYLACTDNQLTVLALWTLHTHCLPASDATPYLNIFSAESRCGKSICLQLLRLLCANPWWVAGVPPSVVIRKITTQRSTLLLDQRETLFGASYSKICGLLTSGARREGTYSLSAGAKGQICDHDVFCPKAFAGDLPLPISLDSLCIPIFLQRVSGDGLQKFRMHAAREAAQSLVQRLQQWAASNLDALRSTSPLSVDQFPQYLPSSHEDFAEPLLQIADLLGGECPLQARNALTEVFELHPEHDHSYMAPLLSDIYDLFSTGNDKRIPTGHLLNYLNSLETRLWRSWNKGGPMTPRNLARLLGHVGIHSRNQRYSTGDRGNGYQYEDFFVPWRGWLPHVEKQALEVLDEEVLDENDRS